MVLRQYFLSPQDTSDKDILTNGIPGLTRIGIQGPTGTKFYILPAGLSQADQKYVGQIGITNIWEYSLPDDPATTFTFKLDAESAQQIIENPLAYLIVDVETSPY